MDRAQARLGERPGRRAACTLGSVPQAEPPHGARWEAHTGSALSAVGRTSELRPTLWRLPPVSLSSPGCPRGAGPSYPVSQALACPCGRWQNRPGVQERPGLRGAPRAGWAAASGENGPPAQGCWARAPPLPTTCRVYAAPPPSSGPQMLLEGPAARLPAVSAFRLGRSLPRRPPPTSISSS